MTAVSYAVEVASRLKRRVGELSECNDLYILYLCIQMYGFG